MTQHLGAAPQPWAGLASHPHVALERPAPPQAMPARSELTAIAMVLGYLARQRLPAAG